MRKPPKAYLSGRSALRRVTVCPIYGTGLRILIVKEPQALTEAMLRNALGRAFGDLVGEGDAYMNGLGRVFSADENAKAGPEACIVIASDCGGGKIRAETVAHEAVHYATFVADLIGFPLNRKHDEPLAYLAGWAAGEIAELCKCYGVAVAAEGAWRG